MMKRTCKALLIVGLLNTLGFAQATTAPAPQPKPVKLESGAVALTPENSRIAFVGEHEGTNPDPRKGGFSKFTGKAQIGDDQQLKSVSFEIETASLWTEIPRLSGHLKSPDFFDVREHPKATFASKSITPAAEEGTFEIAGDFTLLGTKKEIKIPATISVTAQGLTLVSEFEIDRTQFGMTFGEGRVKKNIAITVVIGEPTPKDPS